MKILIKSTLALVLICILIGFNLEILMKFVIVLVLLGTLLKYAEVIISTPNPDLPNQLTPAEATPLTPSPLKTL